MYKSERYRQLGRSFAERLPDRVEEERSFSLAKRCYGLGRIMTKPDVTNGSSIALSILVK